MKKMVGEMKRVITRQNMQLDMFKDEIKSLTAHATSTLAPRVMQASLQRDGTAGSINEREEGALLADTYANEAFDKLTTELDQHKSLLKE